MTHTYLEMLEKLHQLSDNLMKKISAEPQELKLRHYKWSMGFIKDMVLIAAFQNTEMCTEAHLAQVRDWANEMRLYTKEEATGILTDTIKDIVGYLEWQAAERQQTSHKPLKPIND